MDQKFIELVEGAAKARDEMPVPRKFIVQAIGKISCGEVEVGRYPLGSPTLKSVFDVAEGLESEAALKN